VSFAFHMIKERMNADFTVLIGRPPYGDVDDRVRAIATGLGMSTNIWSDDTADWQVMPQGTKPTASVVAAYSSIIDQNYAQHGNIVLTHEINGATMDIMMQMYPTIKEHFKYIVPITACMNITNPYPEAITYPAFADYVAGNVMPSGLPSAKNIQVSPSATYSPVAVASQTGSLSQGSGSSTSGSNSAAGSSSTFGSSSSGSSSSSSSSDSTSSTSAGSTLSTKLSILAGTMAFFAFVVIL
jgi:hypothetical protein